MSPSTRTDAAVPRRRRPADDERGTALVEFAMVASLLLVMVLGVVEYGNAFSAVHTLSSLSRESANLAARGATLQQAIDAALAGGAELGLASRGGVVASRIAMRDGAPLVEEQAVSPGWGGGSRLGGPGDPAPEAAGWGLAEGQIVYTVEIFYGYEPVTPFQGAFGLGIPEVLYERGIF
jgi:Flp pilus assembly pilin Flp